MAAEPEETKEQTFQPNTIYNRSSSPDSNYNDYSADNLDRNPKLSTYKEGLRLEDPNQRKLPFLATHNHILFNDACKSGVVFDASQYKKFKDNYLTMNS